MVSSAQETTGGSPLSMTATAFIFDAAGRLLLTREQDGVRRYGPPGGRVAPGESPQQAVIRAVLAGTGLRVRVHRLIGLYYFADEPQLACTFHCAIERGDPEALVSGARAEMGWFHSNDLPAPLTTLLPHALPDAVRRDYGTVRDVASQQ